MPAIFNMISSPCHSEHAVYPSDPAALPRLLLTLLALALLWPGLSLSQLNPAVLFFPANMQHMGHFLAGFWPPAHSAEFLAILWRATIQTLAIATAGMSLALLLAMPASLVATRVLSISALHNGGSPSAWALALRWPVRGLLMVLRSVPEIVWALLFVRAVGLGPMAGVLAIAITYSGMLGKVYAEIFESVDPQPARALLAAGSPRLAAFLYGVLPQAASEMLSYTVYRWECAIRASVVMGFVGAGGLGQQVDLSLRMFAGDEVASLLLTFFVLVLLADQLSRWLRRALDSDDSGDAAIASPLMLIVVVMVMAFFYLDMDWDSLFSSTGLQQMGRYANGFFPPDTSPAHLHSIMRGALQTLAMAAMGTLLAAVLGLLLALPAAGRMGLLPKALARVILNALRAVPELVWAALMVLAAGLGPNAGALALALHTAGVLGRLYAEALENLPPHPVQALRLAGSGRIASFCYGALPSLWPQLLAYTLYRWENNIRMASVLGFVGAGGLGQMLYVSLSLFQQAQAASVILAMLLLVLMVDVLSGRVRQHWVRH
jgi:phosphonate transport system permease protein